ncbi:MAG: hypothetical protein RIQ93_710 [Verrucomicrobiota bacterium]|jgi:hypothetical protein
MTPRDEEHLEQLTRAALRDLPWRRAPESLPARVLAAIAQQSSGPWWTQGYSRWPTTARVVFVALTLSLLAGGIWVLGGPRPINVIALGMLAGERVQGICAVVSALGNAAAIVIQNINPRWLLGVLGVIALANAVLLGLAAIAYRVLQPDRDSPL